MKEEKPELRWVIMGGFLLFSVSSLLIMEIIGSVLMIFGGNWLGIPLLVIGIGYAGGFLACLLYDWTESDGNTRKQG